MSDLPVELRDLIESGPLTHLSTINADGSPQTTVIWIGLDGDHIVSGHMKRHQKLRNLERDPRATLSFLAPSRPDEFMGRYAVLQVRAEIGPPGEDTWELLDRLARAYGGPGFPVPRGPGYTVRYTVERIGGVGPWVASG